MLQTIDTRTLQSNHAAVLGWIDANAPKNNFAASLKSKMAKYKGLTIGQVLAVQKNLQPKPAPVTAAVNTDGINQVKAAFDAAIASGIKRPKLRLEDFVLSPAKADGKNAGALYVKSGYDYLGKIADGQFYPVKACNDTMREAIVAACSSPLEAAVAYGKKTGVCACCGRELTNKESIELGIGPICRDKWGWA